MKFPKRIAIPIILTALLIRLAVQATLTKSFATADQVDCATKLPGDSTTLAAVGR